MSTPVAAPAPRLDQTGSTIKVVSHSMLLLVIVITTVPVRGLWSVVVILGLVLLAVLLEFTGLWAPILTSLGRLHIYLSAAGYLVLSIVLFLLWLVTVLLFDQRRFMIF